MHIPAVSPRRPMPAGAARRQSLPWAVALAAMLSAVGALAGEPLQDRALALEPEVQGHPERAEAELAALLPGAEAAPAAERRVVRALLGQAMVLAGHATAAAALADKLEAEAERERDAAQRAAALLTRSAVETSVGDAAKAASHAKQARDLAAGAGDLNLLYWAALAHGTAARVRGQPDEAMESLQKALTLAEAADNPYRRSSTLYQLSVLHSSLKNGPEALATSLAAFKYAEAARSAYAMANARMAESQVMELLERPSRELAAMQEALTIARGSHSRAVETRALINLADIRLRRRQFAEAAELSRNSLALAQSVGNGNLVATSKANLGFALLGLGRVPEGKRYAEEAMAEYERTRATAEIADLAGEYGRGLEQIGDFKGALALYHRERDLQSEIALQARQRILLELQEKYEAEQRQREIDLLNRENDLKTAELANQALRQRVWWLLAALFALSFVVVTVLYRKLRVSSKLLAQTNAELSNQSSRDPLTALYNRRYFQSFIAADADTASRGRRDDEGASRALLLIDLDHFKETNDRFGHALGDAVLVAVAERLRNALRDTDTIVRWGGEEFLVIARTAPDGVDEIASRILRAVSAEPIVLNDKVIRSTVSIGYAPMPLPPSAVPLSWDRAIGLVDMALYMAKVNGRNRAYGIHRLVRDDADALAAAERDLERAWKDGLADMHVLYGPQPSSAVTTEMRVARAAAGASVRDGTTRTAS